MGIFDDMVRKMVSEEVAKVGQTSTQTSDAAGAGEQLKPEAASQETEPINKAQEPAKPAESNATANAANDAITISQKDLNELVARAVREGSAAALNAQGSGAPQKTLDPMKSMAIICGLTKRED